VSFLVLPIPVADAADGAAKLRLGQVAQGADCLGQSGAGDQGGGHVLGHPAREREQRLGLQAEIGGERAEEGLGRALRAALDERKVGGRDAEAGGDGADGEAPWLGRGTRQARLTKALPEIGRGEIIDHNC
jgi:hypothetical protein